MMQLDDLDPDYRVAWHQLLSLYLDDADPTDIHPMGLNQWNEDHLIFARAYIGRELSARELARNPNATESLLQEEPRS